MATLPAEISNEQHSMEDNIDTFSNFQQPFVDGFKMVWQWQGTIAKLDPTCLD